MKIIKPSIHAMMNLLAMLSFVVILLGLQLNAFAEPAWWTQKKKECGLSSSTAYNTWVSQGSPCSAKSGGSGGGQSAASRQQQGLEQLNQGIQTLIDGINASTEREEQERLEKEAREAELKRQQETRLEATRQRLLGGMKGFDTSSQLTLKGLSSDTELQLKTGDGDISASSNNTPPSSGEKSKDPKNLMSDAYDKGFADASQCYSQNTSSYCAGLTNDQWELCVNAYRAGFKVGGEQRAQLMKNAYQAGRTAGESNQLANGPSDPNANGPCRVQYIETYNLGYFHGKPAQVIEKK